MCSSLTQHLGASMLMLALFSAGCAEGPPESTTDRIPAAPIESVYVPPIDDEPAKTEVAD